MSGGIFDLLGIKPEGNGVIDAKSLVKQGVITPEEGLLVAGLEGADKPLVAPVDPGKDFRSYIANEGGFKGFFGSAINPLLSRVIFNDEFEDYTDAKSTYAMDSEKYKTLLGVAGKQLERQQMLADPTREALAKQYEPTHPQIAAAIRAGMDLNEIDNQMSAFNQVVSEGSSIYDTFNQTETYRNDSQVVAPGGIDADGLKEIWSEEGRWFDDASRFVNPYNDGLATLKRTLDTGKVYYEEKPPGVSQEEWNQRQATADQALVFGLMKALDENSVVRESEYATAEAQRPTIEMLPQLWRKLETGESLTPEQRKSIIAFSKNVGDELAGRRDKEVSRISRVLDRRRTETQDAYGLSDEDANELFTNVLPALVEYGPDEALSNWLGQPIQQLSEVSVPERRKRSSTPAPAGVDQAIWDYMDPEEQALWQ
jgi:hypothetical protein